ncbi:MAG: endonuclease, partial [Lachnospiraceae bacterium]|nr:endonuclease [Lachnospiraceae bacterium]
AKRSYYIDQLPIFQKATGFATMFANNFKVIYVPFNKGMGKVDAGLLTMTGYKVNSATRYQLPISFSWPISMVNLKRCLLETRIPIEGTDKEIVLVNLHLEAYDSGEGKIAQTKQLMDLLSKEYKAGNYVIAGGDFNQTFEPVKDAYPLTQDTIANNKWQPGIINNSDLAEGFSFAVSDNAATCRLDDHALDATTQLYIIDGFIVSNNITVEQVSNLDKGFAYTDHNPVKMTFKMQ